MPKRNRNTFLSLFYCVFFSPSVFMLPQFLLFSLWISFVSFPFQPPQKQHRQPHHYRQLVQSSSSHANRTAFAYLCCTDATWRPIAPMEVTRATATKAQSYKDFVIMTVSSTASTRKNAFRSSGCAIRCLTAVSLETLHCLTPPTRKIARTARRHVRWINCRVLTAFAYTSRSSATAASTVPTMSSRARIGRRARISSAITTVKLRRMDRNAIAPSVKTLSTQQSAWRRRNAPRDLRRTTRYAISSVSSSKAKTNVRARLATNALVIDALE